MDQVHKETDEKLKEIEEKVKSVYDTAQKEAKEKLDTYLKQFTDEDKEKQADVQAGDMTWTQYKKWRQDKILTGNRYRAMSEQLTSDYVNADKIAMSIVNGFTPEVYAMNYNYGTYEAESGSMVDTSYTLYDRQTVERLIRDDPDLLPKANVDIPKDKRWNRQKLNSAITQGVLQGDSIPDISKRLQSVTDMDRRAAIRNARTMTTSAENGGRQDSYTRAESMGIKMKKQWMATLDSTTRDSHVMADGQVVGTKDTFHLMHGELEFPGDPAGPPAEVYNCRCTMTAIVDGVDEKLKYQSGSYTNTKLGEVTYDEWKEEHQQRADARTARAQKSEQTANTIINGKDISAAWKRRPDQFDFEIEDVINTQGFDGKPRVVSAEEFDKAVKVANNGNGFIAQRTYSAPDQETLDAYRDQLYNGKWYVDCSTGGAQYGQGMYCAADYNGVLSDGIKSEMRHYKEIGQSNIPKDLAWQHKMDSLTVNDFNTSISEKELNALKQINGTAQRKFKDMTDDEKNVITSLRNDSKRGDSIIKELDKIEAEVRRSYVIPSYTETLTLDPSAKVITYRELMDIRTGNLSLDYRTDVINDIIKKSNYTDDEATFIRFNLNTGVTWNEVNAAAGRLTNERIQELSEEFSKIGEEATKRYNEEHARRIERAKMLQHKFSDSGSLATALGYDAINAEGHGQSGSYTVILNRTKCIFKGE